MARLLAAAVAQAKVEAEDEREDGDDSHEEAEADPALAPGRTSMFHRDFCIFQAERGVGLDGDVQLEWRTYPAPVWPSTL